MQENDVYVVNKKAVYLDPCAICEVRHNFLSQTKRAKRVRQLKKAMRRVSAYIAYMMLKWGHWIAFKIKQKNRVVAVFDLLDYDQSTYKEFIFILQKNADLCRFILREVVNPMGTYYHPKHELAQEDKYINLREWENQEYR
ncbi:hypothetical protein SETIT_5G212200v2 [Setaria italica]|uniref:Uncharacterized protein n=1 Tax=Setaria italica TaxID=4555 RepID=A0A368R7I5_SETIT|nr:hypothetical protein SETIT_5G212200v2 [Setaria italica]